MAHHEVTRPVSRWPQPKPPALREMRPDVGDAFTALLDAVDRHRDRAPCLRGPEPWTGDDPAPVVRDAAALLCQRCPAPAECHCCAVAAEERWGVWAGEDRTPKPRKSATDVAPEEAEAGSAEAAYAVRGA